MTLSNFDLYRNYLLLKTSCIPGLQNVQLIFVNICLFIHENNLCKNIEKYMFYHYNYNTRVGEQICRYLDK